MRKSFIFFFTCIIVFFSSQLVFASGQLRDVFVSDVDTITFQKQHFPGIAVYNETKANEIRSFTNNLKDLTTNFASIRIWYKKTSSSNFDYKDIPHSIFFLSKEEKVGNEVTVSHSTDNMDEVLNSYALRGVLKRLQDQGGKCRVQLKDERGDIKEKSFFPIKNLLKWHQFNPLYPSLIHSEQQFFNYFLLAKNAFTMLENDPMDIILINIVSTNAICSNCYTAFKTLQEGKNDFKRQFLEKIFPKTSIKTPIHVLFYTVNEDSYYMKERRDLLRKNPALELELSGNNFYFIDAEAPKKLLLKKQIELSQTFNEDRVINLKLYQTLLDIADRNFKGNINNTLLSMIGIYESQYFPYRTKKNISIKDDLQEGDLFETYCLNNRKTYFRLHKVLGDGSCGFHAIGISRNEAVDLLLKYSSSELPRSLVASEIEAAIREGTLPNTMNTPYHKLPSLYNDLNNFVASYNLSKNLSGNESFSAQQILEILQKESQEQLANYLQNLMIQVKDLEEGLNNYTMEENTYESFVKDYIGGTGWLSYIPDSTTSLDALAAIKNLNIYIFKPNLGSKKLTLVHKTVIAGTGNSVYMLHTHGNTHYDFLEITSPKEKQKKKLRSRSRSIGKKDKKSKRSSSSDNELI